MNFINRSISKIACSVLGLFLFSNVLAGGSPVAMLDQVSTQMIHTLEKNKGHLKNNGQAIYRIVNQILVPHVDMNRMGMEVVGRQYWMKSNSAEHAAFLTHFKRLVISTYSAALESYDGDTVHFFPLRANYASSNAVQVNSMIVRRNGQRIPVNYNLVRSGGDWKVYDFSIENVSMIQSYRSQFSDVLAQSGLSGLIQRLKNHNQAS